MGGSRVYVGVDVQTEELENKTIVLEPTTTAINLARKLRKMKSFSPTHTKPN